QVAHEHERALEDPDEQGRPTGVVGGDLLAELSDPAAELFLADHHPTDVGVLAGELHEREATAARPRGAARTVAPCVLPRAPSPVRRRAPRRARARSRPGTAVATRATHAAPGGRGPAATRAASSSSGPGRRATMPSRARRGTRTPRGARRPVARAP